MTSVAADEAEDLMSLIIRLYLTGYIGRTTVLFCKQLACAGFIYVVIALY